MYLNVCTRAFLRRSYVIAFYLHLEKLLPNKMFPGLFACTNTSKHQTRPNTTANTLRTFALHPAAAEIRDMECTSDAFSVTAKFKLKNKPVNAAWAWTKVG